MCLRYLPSHWGSWSLSSAIMSWVLKYYIQRIDTYFPLPRTSHFVTISLFPNPGEMTREVARFGLSRRGLNNHVVDEVWCGWINIPGKEEVNVFACQLRIFMLFLTLTFQKLVWYVELMTTQVVGQLMSEGSQWVDTQLPMFQASTQFPSL